MQQINSIKGLSLILLINLISFISDSLLQLIIYLNQKLIMQNNIWTIQSERILKVLKQQRKIQSWKELTQILQIQFNIKNKSEQQCKQRYEKILNNITKKDEWTLEEEKIMIQLHNKYGNKWVQISNHLKRNDNTVKNHFHSTLKKGLRNINKFILNTVIKEIKPTVLSKIIKVLQDNYKDLSLYPKQLFSLAFKLKNNILVLSYQKEDISSQSLEQVKKIAIQINEFIIMYQKHKSDKFPRINSRYKGKQIISLLNENAKNVEQCLNNSKQKNSNSPVISSNSLENDKQFEQDLANQPLNFKVDVMQPFWLPNYNLNQTIFVINQPVIPVSNIYYVPLPSYNVISATNSTNSSFYQGISSFNSFGQIKIEESPEFTHETQRIKSQVNLNNIRFIQNEEENTIKNSKIKNNQSFL